MVYADSDAVTTRTNEVREGTNDGNIYNALLSQALGYADRKINSQLRKNRVPIPTIPNPVPEDDLINDLLEAGNLYACSFIFYDYYSSK